MHTIVYLINKWFYLINKWFSLTVVDADHCMRMPTRRHIWHSELDRTQEETGQEESEGVDTNVRITDLLKKKKPRKK